MAGRKQRGRGGGRGYRGGRGFGRGGSRGGRGDGSHGRGRGRGQGYRYVTMDEVDGDFVVDIAHPRTSLPPFWRMFFMAGALQSPGMTRAVVRRLRAQGDANA